MNEVNFRIWLSQNEKNKKVTSDSISRLKKLERELGIIDIDIEYNKDRCEYLLSLFENTGRNARMNKYKTELPIGKYSLNTYKYALRLYCKFLEDVKES